MSTELEQWRHFRRGFSGYHVSNFGRIMGPRGILRGEIDKNGYHRVCVRYEGSAKHIMVHRLVAMAWIPNPGKKRIINHKDANKANNRPENLEWVTQKENIAHSWAMGLQKPRRGSDHYSAKLNPAAVIDIRSHATVAGVNQIFAEKYSVSPATVHNVLTGKTWRHVA